MKRTMALMLVLVMMVAVFLPGCGKSDNETSSSEPDAFVSSNEDNTVTISTTKLGKGTGGLAYITVSEGEELVVEKELLKKSQIELKIYAAQGEQSIDEIPAEATGDAGEPTLELVAEGTGTDTYALEPGDYTISVMIQKKSTGTITIRTQQVAA